MYECECKEGNRKSDSRKVDGKESEIVCVCVAALSAFACVNDETKERERESVCVCVCVKVCAVGAGKAWYVCVWHASSLYDDDLSSIFLTHYALSLSLSWIQRETFVTGKGEKSRGWRAMQWTAVQ